MTDDLPPAMVQDADVAALLARRIDVHLLSRGMIVGMTDATGHRFVAHGHTDTARTRLIDLNTLFEIGSITKVFTALILADLVERGEAALDEPVQNLLPSGVRVPARNKRPITLLDLASHRSGLPRMPANFGLAEQTDPDRPYTPDLLYAFLADHDLARTPGTSKPTRISATASSAMPLPFERAFRTRRSCSPASWTLWACTGR